MAGLINIQPIDTPDVEQTQFGDDMKRWLANIVDVINNNFSTLNEALAITTVDAGGMGATATISQLGMVPAGTVTVNLLSSTIPVNVISVKPGTDSFTVTFSADPGAHAIIQYTALAVGLGS